MLKHPLDISRSCNDPVTVYLFEIKDSKRRLISPQRLRSSWWATFICTKLVWIIKSTPLHAYSLIKLIRPASIVTLRNSNVNLPFTVPLHERTLRKWTDIGSAWPGTSTPGISIGLHVHIVNHSVNSAHIRLPSETRKPLQAQKYPGCQLFFDGLVTILVTWRLLNSNPDSKAKSQDK